MDNGASSYRRFLEGDERAFESIMQELFHGLVFFLCRYVHNPQTAEDLAIDTFSDLIVHKHRYNFKVTLKTYLYMVGRSRALDFLRKQKRFPLTELSETLPDDAMILEEMQLIDEEKRRVHGAISQLPEEMRVVIHLIYFEDMTYDQAAKVMKKNRKQIDNLLYRAKKELRTILGKDGEENL